MMALNDPSGLMVQGEEELFNLICVSSFPMGKVNIITNGKFVIFLMV